MERYPVLADTLASSRPTPDPRARSGRLVSWSVGVGLLLLVGSVGLVILSTQAPTHASAQTETSKPSARFERDAVAVAFVDTEGGMRQLYPTQLGRVVALPVPEDKIVEAGTELLRVDDTVAKAQLAEASLDLQAARKRHEQAKLLIEQHSRKVKAQEAVIEAIRSKRAAAKAQADKVERLFKSGLSGGAEDVLATAKLVEEAEAGIAAETAKLDLVRSMDPNTAVELAALDVESKEKQEEKARHAVRECSIFAPCKGKILRNLAAVGEVLGPNPRQPALVFCPDAKRIVRAEVEQEFARKLRRGQKATISDDSTGSGMWRGTIDRVSDWYAQRRSILLEPMQFNDVRTLEVILHLDDPKDLRIGQRVRVKIDDDK